MNAPASSKPASSADGVTFRTTLQLGGKTATGLPVPEDVVSRLGGSRRPAVRVTIHGYGDRASRARARLRA